MCRAGIHKLMASQQPATNGVFISHITEEKAVALELQRYLRKAFGADFPVFVSSDPQSIGGGRAWWNHIRERLKTARVALVSLSNESVTREWINYEAGVGDGAGACVIPMGIDRYSFNYLDFPLKGFQGRYVEELEGIVGDIERETGLTAAPLDQKQYQADIVASTARIVRRGIALEPYVEVRGGSNLLRFRISNTGTRDVELVEVEAAVPSSLILAPDWRPGAYPVIHSDFRTVDAVPHLVLRETAFGGHLDVIRYGKNECLPPVFARNMSPRVLAFLQFPLNPDAKDPHAFSIFYHVVAKGLNLPELKMRLSDIPVASATKLNTIINCGRVGSLASVAGLLGCEHPVQRTLRSPFAPWFH
jgi:hypothetical protein